MQRRRQPASIREFYPAADVRAANAPQPHRALGEPVPHVAHGNDKRDVGLQHACERRGNPAHLVPYLTPADQASLYVIFSKILNPIFPEHSATSDSGAKCQTKSALPYPALTFYHKEHAALMLPEQTTPVSK